mgnify:CR=1 FL=1
MLSPNIRKLAKLFVVATGVALGVRLFLLEDYRITSDSMFPNVMKGDLVLVTKFTFNIRFPFSTYEVMKFRKPERSEVVAFVLPDRGIDTFVKRVVGLSGDRIEIKGGVLIVNGKPAEYAPAPSQDGVELVNEDLGQGGHRLRTEGGKIPDYGPVEIPDGHFFALGDNRVDSIDSRSWGPVPYSCLKGGVQVVWLSLNERGGVREGRIGPVVR